MYKYLISSCYFSVTVFLLKIPYPNPEKRYTMMFHDHFLAICTSCIFYPSLFYYTPYISSLSTEVILLWFGQCLAIVWIADLNNY